MSKTRKINMVMGCNNTGIQVVTRRILAQWLDEFQTPYGGVDTSMALIYVPVDEGFMLIRNVGKGWEMVAVADSLSELDAMTKKTMITDKRECWPYVLSSISRVVKAANRLRARGGM